MDLNIYEITFNSGALYYYMVLLTLTSPANEIQTFVAYYKSS